MRTILNGINASLLLAFMLIGSSLQAVNASEIPPDLELKALDIISMPQDFKQHKLKIEHQQPTLSKQSFNPNKKDTSKEPKDTKSRICSMCKKFGPLEVQVRVNPVRANRTGLRVDLDLIHAYQIISSKQELSEAFKPSPEHNIIHPKVKQTFNKIFTKDNANSDLGIES